MRVIPDDMWGPLCIFAEARGEPFHGQVAVGNVIRNRMRKAYFSDGTVSSTVLWPYQFSWMNTKDHQRTRVLEVDMEDQRLATAIRAWQRSAEEDVVPPETVLYHAHYVDPDWARSPRTREVARVGAHIFYEQV